MPYVNIEQGSQDWLELRRSKITASEAPIILDLSPYKTAYELWLEKTGRIDKKLTASQQNNFDYGHAQEAIVREEYATQYALELSPAVAVHNEHQWLMASLDAITPDKKLMLEIKTCSAEVYDTVVQTNEMPAHHWLQMQIQMACCPEVEVADYVLKSTKGKRSIRVERADITDHVEQLHAWYQKHIIKDESPDESKDFIFVENNDELQRAFDDYFKAKEAEVAAKTVADAAKERLIAFSKNAKKNIWVSDYRIERSSRLGNVDYKEIPELKDIDLDQYRNPPTVIYSIKKNK